MGMYTEIIFGASLKKSTPDNIIEIVQKLVDGIDVGIRDCDHDFFRSERRWLLTSGGSFYFPGTVGPKFWFDDIAKQWFLHFRTNLKNYGSEIEKFLDWIKPHLDDGSGSGNFYAIVTHEDGKPMIYYLSEE